LRKRRAGQTVIIGFPATADTDEDTKVNAVSLTKLVVTPVKGEEPVTTGISAAQYTGTIAWEDDDGDASAESFVASTVYKAVIMLTAREGFTFKGVAANRFVSAGATSVRSATGNGKTITVTITFKATEADSTDPDPEGPEATPASALNLTAPITAPAKATAPIDAAQYTGGIAWKKENDSDFTGNFDASSVYKAVITLTAKAGFTFEGIAANSFRYDEATVTNAAGNGTTMSVTIVFPVAEALGTVSGITGTAGNEAVGKVFFGLGVHYI
jgi:hypothetical protein